MNYCDDHDCYFEECETRHCDSEDCLNVLGGRRDGATTCWLCLED